MEMKPSIRTTICSVVVFRLCEADLSALLQAVAASLGSIAAVCETRRFMENEAEHNTTKRLLTKHSWEKYGEE